MKRSENKKQRGDNIKMILGLLAGSAFLTLELLDEVFGARARSYKAMHSMMYGGSGYDENAKEDYNNAELQRFYSILNKLKSQGFIKKKKSEHGSLWNITKRGLEKLGVISKKKKITYNSKTDNKLKIIVFDIPERERWKRAWLREALNALEFSMLQQSVWIGKNKVPEQFLEDLRDMRLFDRIHILEVSASGTLRSLS